MKRFHVTLTEPERAKLEALVTKRKADSQVVKRAFALLAADENQLQWLTDQQIQQTYRLSLRTVERLRERFVEEGIEVALNGKQREKFKEKLFDGVVEAHLIALRCSQPPVGYARWTIQLLTDQLIELSYVETIGRETVRTILKKMRSSPGRSVRG